MVRKMQTQKKMAKRYQKMRKMRRKKKQNLHRNRWIISKHQWKRRKNH